MTNQFTRILLGLLLAATSAFAVAEVEKSANPGVKRTEFNWWPKLPDVPGWRQDMESSFQHNINALAPVGKQFSGAETLIYAKAVFKHHVPEVKSLAALIDNEKNDFLKNEPGGLIRQSPALSTADGAKVVSLTYIRKSHANWERVSYLDEDEFYIIFTISSDTKSGFDASSKVYENLISRYRKTP
jgi:hypothetical protein